MDKTQKIKEFRHRLDSLRQEVSKVIIGQEEVIDVLTMSIFCQGHCLLIGAPGLAKTLTIKTLASVLDVGFSRIQFTPDLMPSDITGSEILNPNKEMSFIKGPIFSNIVLADEINRTPPKTQAALLEAMQEYSVTIGGKRYALEKPFFVLATQNPIEQEGTYPLPEAQLDRFMLSVVLNYPSYEEEVQVVKATTTGKEVVTKPVFTHDEIIELQSLVRDIPVVDNVIEYAVMLVQKTRPGSKQANKITNEYVSWGAGPRASQNLILLAKFRALIQNRFSPDIKDVQAIAPYVLRHRIIRNFKAEAEEISVEKIIVELL